MDINQYTKQELVRFGKSKCKHGHTLLSHPGCIEDTPERIGHLDIEASNLDADFGIILSYCIKVDGEEEIVEGVITATDIADAAPGQEDRVVVQKLVDDMQGFDKIITYYGTRFDIPFIRTRAKACGVKFPSYGALTHKDLYFTVKAKFKLSSNRLENACRVILGKSRKNRIDAKYWRGGVRGDAESLEYILGHNRRDVKDLEELYHEVIGYGRPSKNSI